MCGVARPAAPMELAYCTTRCVTRQPSLVPFRAPLPPRPVSAAFRVVPQMRAPGLPWLWRGCGGAWGGGSDAGPGPRPPVFPLGGADACTPRQDVTLLYGPSICTRSVPKDLRCSQVLRRFPTPGWSTLWVAGVPLRDERVSCLPRWPVCPTRSSTLGTNCSKCDEECSLSGPLVTPPVRCHLGRLTNGPGRFPPCRVCSGGAKTVTGGGPKPLRRSPLPASPVGTFCPDFPLPLCWPRLFHSPPSFLTFPRLPACTGAPTVPCLSLAPSLCPSLHRHDAQQLHGRAWVGVARACVSPVTLVAQHPARPPAGTVFASVSSPHPALSPVTVPLPPSYPSRRRPRGVVFCRFIFSGGALMGGRGGGGGFCVVPSPGTMQARYVAQVCGGGLCALSLALFHPAAPPAAVPPGPWSASSRRRSLPPHRLCSVQGGGGVWSLVPYSAPSFLVTPPPAASRVRARCKHSHHTFTTIITGCRSGFLSTRRYSCRQCPVPTPSCAVIYWRRYLPGWKRKMMRCGQRGGLAVRLVGFLCHPPLLSRGGPLSRYPTARGGLTMHPLPGACVSTSIQPYTGAVVSVYGKWRL